MQQLKCVLLDDEIPGLTYLKLLCEQIPKIEIVKSFNDPLLFIKEQEKLEYDLCICDIEMPEMDGYTFTAEVRNHPDLKKLHIVLHTSLSGVFNEAMVRKVGANDFLAKFHPDELARRVNDRVLAITGESILPPEEE